MPLNTQLVAIVNITPDSFSGDGKLSKTLTPIDHCKNLIQQGAHVLDIGAESTRPGATPVNPTEEWERLAPYLENIISLAREHNVLVSLDTRHPETAKKAITLGVNWINDVGGFNNQNMIEIVANSDVTLVAMHNLGVPADKNNVLPHDKNPMDEILLWGEQKIQQLGANGILSERVIFDPGIGFGKSSEQSINTLQQIDRLETLGVDILVGHSRKSFIQTITHAQARERDIETLSVSLYLAQKNTHYLRVHNVDYHTRAFATFNTLVKR